MYQSPAGQSEADSGKQLMLLMVRHQRQILSYIYTLVPNRHDAEDLLQETSLVICEKFAQFKPGTNFLAWACQIAYWQVRAARQRFARQKLVFGDEILEAVAKTSLEMADELNSRHVALESCLKKLPGRDRDLLQGRYEAGGSVELAALRSGRALDAAYKALARIRKLLLECVNRQLAAQGAP